MQIIFEDEDERSNSRGTNSMGIIIYEEKIGWYLEEKLVGKLEIREIRIWVSRRIFVRVKKKFSREDKE